jgi:hypothetical protein
MYFVAYTHDLREKLPLKLESGIRFDLKERKKCENSLFCSYLRYSCSKYLVNRPKKVPGVQEVARALFCGHFLFIKQAGQT